MSEKQKAGRIDLQATLNSGTIVNIEMQVENEHNIEKRSLIYSANTLARNILRGNEYNEAKEVIMINILDFKLLEFEEYVSKTVTVLEEHRDFDVESLIDTYFIELPKFRKAEVDMNDKLCQWLAFIDGEDWGRIEMAKEKNEKIKKAEIVRTALAGDTLAERMQELEEIWAYERAEDIYYAKKEGQNESKKEIAKKLKEKNIDIAIISETTGLTLEEIKKLK